MGKYEEKGSEMNHCFNNGILMLIRIDTNDNVVYVFDHVKAQLHTSKTAAENIRRIRAMKEKDGIIESQKIMLSYANTEV